MESLQELLLLGIRASLFITVLDDATYVFRKPRLLLRAYLPIAVIVPAFAALLMAALSLPWFVEAAILLMAVSPLPPFLPSKEVRIGAQKAYVYGLLVAFALLSVLIVPLTVTILSATFSEYVSIAPAAVVRLILIAVVVPLAIGMLFQAWAPGAATRIAPFACAWRLHVQPGVGRCSRCSSNSGAG